jgi:ribonuclease HII
VRNAKVSAAQAQFIFPTHSTRVRRRGYLAGVDEAGRGPLAGPVVAAAVILNPKKRIRGIDDSKALTAAERETLAIKIRSHAIAWSVAWADAAEIDALNILQATFLAMRRAVCGLHVAPNHVQIDGNGAPSFASLRHDWDAECSYETIVQGDALVDSIGAASILAKTTRDAMMVELDAVFPHYGFASHKGYAVPVHYRALQEHGPCVQHRRSFEPVRLAGNRDSRFEIRDSTGLLFEFSDSSPITPHPSLPP